MKERKLIVVLLISTWLVAGQPTWEGVNNSKIDNLSDLEDEDIDYFHIRIGLYFF